MIDALSESEVAFLDALRHGETANDYARRTNYSVWWAKKKSRRIRDKLGVQTIQEAVAMSEAEGVGRADFDKLTGLVSSLAESVENLAKARPADQPAAQAVVQQRELDVKDHAKALGLSLDDVKRLQDEKEYDKFRGMQERLDKERADAAAEVEDDDTDKRSAVEKVVDGLGGIRNVKPAA